MDHIQAVDTWDAYFLHGFILNDLDHFSCLRPGMGSVTHNIQDGTDLVFSNNLVEFGRIKTVPRGIL